MAGNEVGVAITANKQTGPNMLNLLPIPLIDGQDSYVFMEVKVRGLSSSGVFFDKMQSILKKMNEIKLPTNMAEFQQQIVDGVLSAIGSAVVGGLDAIEDVIKIVQDDQKTIAGEIINSIIGLKDDIIALLGEIHSNEGGASPTEEVRANIYLPLPNILSTALSHNYETDEMNTADKILTSSGYLMNTLLSPFKVGPNAKTGKMSKKGFLMNKFVSSASAAPNAAKKLLNFYTEQSKRSNAPLDTNIITTYRGTKLRQFSFPIHIIPYSQEHAKKIIEGLLWIKYYMTGQKTAGNMIIKQDNCFEVSFYNVENSASKFEPNEELNTLMGLGENIYLNLTGLSVTYGADGALMMYKDGMPKSITITLNFVERKPLYDEPTTTSNNKQKK